MTVSMIYEFQPLALLLPGFDPFSFDAFAFAFGFGFDFVFVKDKVSKDPIAALCML